MRPVLDCLFAIPHDTYYSSITTITIYDIIYMYNLTLGDSEK